MDNNEILKEAQKGKPKDYALGAKTVEATKIAAVVSIIVVVLMMAFEYIIHKEYDFGKPLIIVIFFLIFEIMEWKHTKKVRKLIAFIAGIILGIICFILYIRGVLLL